MERNFPPTPFKEHPYKDCFSKLSCKDKECSEEHQIVEKSTITIHPHSGDAYGDYTIKCKKCGKIEDFSFADN